MSYCGLLHGEKCTPSFLVGFLGVLRLGGERIRVSRGPCQAVGIHPKSAFYRLGEGSQTL